MKCPCIRPPGGSRLCRAVWPAVAMAACLIHTAAFAAEPPAWPQWRGPAGDGHAPSARDLPVHWSETENITWKTPLPGRGWSSPVIGGPRIWLTTAIETPLSETQRQRRLAGVRNAGSRTLSGPVQFHAICLDRDTGRILHDVMLCRVDDPQPIHKLNSYASPSPVLAGGRLYCSFGDFGTAAVDATTGQLLWTNRLLRLDHVNGPGSTPLLYNDLLIVACDGSDVQFIAALECGTGKLRWKTARSGKLRDDPDLKKAYGTPLIITQGGRDLLVSPAADWLYGYDPATGKELWKLAYGDLGFSVVPKPVTAGDLLFMSTSFNQPQILAVKLKGPDTPQILWRERRAAPRMPSMLVVGSELYVVNDAGIATCLETASGKKVWTGRLGGNFSSSPLYADGRIYAGNREGETFVFRPGRAFTLEATNQLDGSIMASPVAVGRSIYLRTDAAIYCIEKGDSPSQPLSSKPQSSSSS